jgi:hypothetical protein
MSREWLGRAVPTSNVASRPLSFRRLRVCLLARPRARHQMGTDSPGRKGNSRIGRRGGWSPPSLKARRRLHQLPRHQSPLRAGRRLVGEATVVAVVHAAVARAVPACPAPRLLVLGRLAAEAGSNSSSTYAMPTGRSTRSGRRRRTRPCAPCAPAGVRPKHTSV